MGPIRVMKFGGTSLATGTQVRKAAEIIRSRPGPSIVVVSAPGVRYSGDTKVTDLLIQFAHADRVSLAEFYLDAIRSRYRCIAEECNIPLDTVITDELERLRTWRASNDLSAILSAGERIQARLMCVFMKARFLDPADCMLCSEEGKYDLIKSREVYLSRVKKKIRSNSLLILPGFYAVSPLGKIHTFSRGGSDLTAARIAEITQASVCETWKDVSGMRMAHPRIVPDARVIPSLTYEELRELTYMGSEIIHEAATVPLSRAAIPLEIRNTDAPHSEYTRVTSIQEKTAIGIKGITGISGRTGFIGFEIREPLVNEKVGFLAEICRIFALYNLSIEHAVTGIDSVSIMIRSVSPTVVSQIKESILNLFPTATIVTYKELAVVSVVGHGLRDQVGVSEIFYGALRGAGISAKAHLQGLGELSICATVAETDYEKTVQALYRAFVTQAA